MKHSLAIIGLLILSGCVPADGPQAPVTFSTQEECEQTTTGACSFVTCDYIPEGKTFDEVCGKGFKEGWTVSSEKK